MFKFPPQFTKGFEENLCYYPLRQVDIDTLSKCRITSPRVGNNYGIKLPEDFDLEEATFEILRVRDEVKDNIYPQWFMNKYYPYNTSPVQGLTDPLKNENLSTEFPTVLAEIVHMDFPIDLGKACVKWLLKKGYNVKAKVSTYVNFLKSIPHVEEALTNQIKIELERGFEAKWFFGLARPEEVAGFNCTSYEEGCPTHPSFPQGHGCAALANVNAILEIFEPLPEIIVQELLDTAYLWGQFRCLAGVHYGIDFHGSLAINPLRVFMKNELYSKYKQDEAID